MFRCFDKQANGDVVIIGSVATEIATLRSKGRGGVLVCPECQQSVLVRAGQRKTPHFAHKTLQDCPLRGESAEILKARQVLYQWLCSKYPTSASGQSDKQDVIKIEHRLSNKLDRPVDCLLETRDDRRIAYWILERRMRDRRENCHLLEQAGVEVRWVFLSSLLKLADDELDLCDLSTTEREFSMRSRYDRPYSAGPMGTSLHYLNPEDETLTTLRGLGLDHSPQRYRFGAMFVHPMAEILTQRDTGEFIHPGEAEVLMTYKREWEAARAREAAELAARSISQISQRRPLRTPDSSLGSGLTPRILSSTHSAAKSSTTRHNPMEEPLKCTGCGKLTTDWRSADLGAGTCECSSCSRQRR